MSLEQQETPTLAKVIQDSIKGSFGDLHTSLPGIVDAVDHVKKTVDVRISLKRKYKLDNEPIELPKLVKVPLGFLQTKKTIISVPVAPGDDVWVFFSERSLDVWKNTSDQEEIENRIVNPNDPRMHHFSDCIAMPAVKPIKNGLASNPTDIMIQHKEGNKLTIAPSGEMTYINEGTGKINVNAGGKWFVGNSQEELLTILDDTLQAILDAVTNTQIGPQPFVNLADFSAIKARLAKIKQ